MRAGRSHQNLIPSELRCSDPKQAIQARKAAAVTADPGAAVEIGADPSPDGRKRICPLCQPPRPQCSKGALSVQAPQGLGRTSNEPRPSRMTFFRHSNRHRLMPPTYRPGVVERPRATAGAEAGDPAAVPRWNKMDALCLRQNSKKVDANL